MASLSASSVSLQDSDASRDEIQALRDWMRSDAPFPDEPTAEDWADFGEFCLAVNRANWDREIEERGEPDDAYQDPIARAVLAENPSWWAASRREPNPFRRYLVTLFNVDGVAVNSLAFDEITEARFQAELLAPGVMVEEQDVPEQGEAEEPVDDVSEADRTWWAIETEAEGESALDFFLENLHPDAVPSLSDDHGGFFGFSEGGASC